MKNEKPEPDETLSSGEKPFFQHKTIDYTEKFEQVLNLLNLDVQQCKREIRQVTNPYDIIGANDKDGVKL